MKLQVGCGSAQGDYKRKPEWINLDIIKHDNCNVVGSGFALPFKTNTFDEVHCIHTLEHVTRDKYSVMLGEMYRVLAPGGFVYVEVPDFAQVARNLVAALDAGDTRAIHVWTTSIYGKNERSGMAHHWGFYEGLLRREFRRQGYKNIERITDINNMVSGHYRSEPIILVRGWK